MKKKLNLNNLVARELLKSQAKKLADLNLVKRRIAKKFHLPILSNVELLKAYHSFCKNKRLKPNKKIEFFLRKRKIRSLSGIVVISVLTKPYPCPGKCLYCPSQKGIPKSYLDNEPAVMRAILNKFNPYRQVQTRLKALELTGHPTDKIELIIIGGTWSFLPKKYQTWFIKRCFESCNEFSSKRKTQSAKLKLKAQNLQRVQKRNEKAKHRIIGITIETRPDFINEEEIINLRKLGITRVEFGVQSIYDDILKLNMRGHNVSATIKATRLLKDAGFKVCYHLMPNLPGSDLKRDEKMFEEIFKNPDFQPDLLKIYPCAILKEALLYKMWKEKKYKPYKKSQLINLLKKVKKKIPYYCRIQRLTRDIPSPSIIAGPAKISNLRQILVRESKKEGWKCHCIRCREVRENYNPKEKLYLYRQDYKASDGKEIFLSYESKNQEWIYSLLRLRIPSQIFKRGGHFIPTLQNSAIIRELHTYGQLEPLTSGGRTSPFSPQHKGLGKKLIREAERIVKEEFWLDKISVISGVGVRNYYRKLCYNLRDSYMVKKF